MNIDLFSSFFLLHYISSKVRRTCDYLHLFSCTYYLLFDESSSKISMYNCVCILDSDYIRSSFLTKLSEQETSSGILSLRI